MKLAFLIGPLAAAAALTVPKPVPLGIYSRCVSTASSGRVCDPTLQIARDGKRVSAVTVFPACSRVPLRKAPSARIARGRFHFTGTVRNVLRPTTKVKVRIAGHVLSRKRIRVSYRMTTAACTDRTHTVTLVYRKTGKPGEVG